MLFPHMLSRSVFRWSAIPFSMRCKTATAIALLALTAMVPAYSARGETAASGEPVVTAADMNALIAAAKQEGSVTWAVSPSFLPGVQPLQALVKQLYGIDIKITANATLSYPAKVAKSALEMKSHVPASYDLLDITDLILVQAENLGVAATVDYKKYNSALPADAILHGRMLINSDQYLAPVYNTAKLAGAGIPTTWNALTAPSLKGKIVASEGVQDMIWLGQSDAMGPDKMLALAKALGQQDLFRGRYGDQLDRITSGEYTISTGIITSNYIEAKNKGAPIAMADMEYVRLNHYGTIVPVNVQHPNASVLVSLALATPQGQKLHDQFGHSTAVWATGAVASDFPASMLKGKVVIDDVAWLAEPPTAELAKKVDGLLSGDGSK